MAVIRAKFNNQQSYEKFVNALKSSITLGKWKVTSEPISYNPGSTVSITCEEEDVETINIIILSYGQHAP